MNDDSPRVVEHKGFRYDPAIDSDTEVLRRVYRLLQDGEPARALGCIDYHFSRINSCSTMKRVLEHYDQFLGTKDELPKV